MGLGEGALVKLPRLSKNMADLQKEIGIEKNINLFLDCCGLLANIFKEANIKEKGVDGSTFIYLFPFLFEQIERTVLTPSYIANNMDKLSKFVLSFIDFAQDAGENQRANKRIKDKKYYNKAIDHLKNSFIAADLDISIKGKPECAGVYVVKISDDIIKIGKSDSSIKNRVKAAQTYGGKLIGLLSFNSNDETKYHEIFSEFRIVGQDKGKELFTLNDKSKNLLKKHEMWGCGF